MTEPTETAASLAETLRETTANLDVHIETRASQIAAERTAPLKAEVARIEAARQSEAAAAEARRQDVVDELHRQIDRIRRGRAEAQWITGYLPEGLRLLYASSRWPFELPSEAFMADADERARAAGFDPAAHPGQDARQRALAAAAKQSATTRPQPDRSA
jgi:hypothetical protein